MTAVNQQQIPPVGWLIGLGGGLILWALLVSLVVIAIQVW